MPGPNVRAYEALTTQFDNLKISNIIWTELTEKTCWSMKWRAINYVFWALFWLTLVKRLMTAMWIQDKHQNVAVVLVIDLLQILSHHGWHFPWLPWSSNGARKVNRYLIPRRLWFRSLSRRYARAQCESIWSIDNTIWQSQNIQYYLNRINGEDLLEYEVTSHKLCVLALFWLTLVKRLMTAMWIHDKHQNVAVVLVIDLLQILSHHGWHFPWLPWSSNGARKVSPYLIPRRLWFRSLSRRYARAQFESIWSIDNTIWQSQNMQYNLNRINGEDLLEYEVTSHKLCVLGTFLVDSCQKTDDRHVDSRQAPECGCCPGHWFAPNLVTPWVAFPLTSVVLKWS